MQICMFLNCNIVLLVSSFQTNTHAENTHAGNTHAGNTHAGNTHAGNNHAGNTHAEVIERIAVSCRFACFLTVTFSFWSAPSKKSNTHAEKTKQSI